MPERFHEGLAFFRSCVDLRTWEASELRSFARFHEPISRLLGISKPRSFHGPALLRPSGRTGLRKSCRESRRPSLVLERQSFCCGESRRQPIDKKCKEQTWLGSTKRALVRVPVKIEHCFAGGARKRNNETVKIAAGKEPQFAEPPSAIIIIKIMIMLTKIIVSFIIIIIILAPDLAREIR